MNRDVQARLDALERTAVRHRIGIVTDDSPLSVSLGGSAVPYTGVSTIATGLAVDDVVSVLLWGNDLIVLGVIT